VTVTDRTSPRLRGNVLQMAARLVKGSAVGVVIATGDETVRGQLLGNHDWPANGSLRTTFGGEGEGEMLVSTT
jgi:magnesium-transporting ATPase (P-type)